MGTSKMWAGPMLSPDEFWVRVRAMDERLRESFAERACFGLGSWRGSRMIDEWALGDSTFRSVRYDRDDGTAEVMVATSDGGEDSLHHVVANLPSDEPFEQRMERMRTSRIPAAIGHAEIAVSRQFVQFALRSVNDYLIADATVEGLHILIRVRGVGLEELRVELIDDVQPYLDGRNAMIRKARADHGIIDPE
jgi:hypothetical protein